MRHVRHSPQVYNIKDARRLKDHNKYFNAIFFKNQNQCKKFTMNKISKFEVRTGSVIVPCGAVSNLETEGKISGKNQKNLSLFKILIFC